MSASGAAGASDASAPAVQTASSDDSKIAFSFSRGADASEIDDSLLSSVVVTIVTMPTADGRDFSAELDVAFTDGGELSATYTAPVTTAAGTCVGTGS